MPEQFLNLEGRDTFNANNNYEKVKIVNGGTPQNSDLNEQSSIDEERARNIIKEGFGSGKLNPTDFLLHLESSELTMVERENEVGVLGTLWQGGFRLKLLNNGDYTIADNDTTPIYRKLGLGGSRKGRVYLCHAKQDYLDPSAKLTVRDINDINLIQIDTAVREKRVVDYFIDWSEDEGEYPDRIDSNDAVLLDNTGIFSGKEDFSSSPLNGFSGYVYYLGDIFQTPTDEDIDQQAQEEFRGNSDNVLYTGGDSAHRRDTEVSGLIYAGTGSPTYDGLKASPTGSVGAWHTGINVGGTARRVSLPTIDIKETQDAGSDYEQLHIPSLNNYFKLETALTGKEVVQDILVDGFGTLTAALEAVLATLATPVTPTEGQTTNFLLLYVKDTEFAGLNNVASYHLRFTDLSTAKPTESEFPIALFKLVLDAVSGNDLTFRLVYTATGMSYLYDRRRYFINVEDKTAEAGKMMVSNPDRCVIKATGATLATVPGDLVNIDGTIYSIVAGTTISPTNVRIVLDYISGTASIPSAGLAISFQHNGGAWNAAGSVLEVLLDPAINPAVDYVDRDFTSRAETPLSHQTISELDGTTITPKPRTLSSALAQLRGMFGQLLPVESNRYPHIQWFDLLKKGMRIQRIQTYLNSLQTVVWGLIAPSSPISSSGVKIINFTLSGTANKEGLIMLVDGTRTLRDAAGGTSPVIKLQGTSQTGLPFASFIHLKHIGNTGAVETLGTMLLLEGQNGLAAIPVGETIDAPTRLVLIDGQTGTLKSNILITGTGTFATLTCTGKATLEGSVNSIRGTDTAITGAQLNTLIGHGNADSLHNHGGDFVPIGTIIASILSAVPSGYLYCDGSDPLIASYPDLSAALETTTGSLFTTGIFGNSSSVDRFKLPDLRGMFLRGQDDSAGVDLDAGTRTALATGGNDGDNIGSFQEDAFKKTDSSNEIEVGGTVVYATAVSQQPPMGGGMGNYTTANHKHSVDGGSDNETRPKNVYVRYYIKY